MARETRDSIGNIWGERTPYRGEWSARVDEHVVEEPDRWVQSACVLCSNGCALDIGVKDGRIVGVRGREVDRVNRGRLGPKGLHGWEANGSPDRLTHPLVRRGGRLERATWDEAMELIVQRSKEIVERHTGLGIGIYNTGQLFLEEYHTLAVLGRVGLGTRNMDGNTRLCTATAASSLQESFGCDGQPGSYSDIDVTDALLLVGTNLAEAQTVLWMRMLDRLEGPDRPRLVVIDPRVTPTAERADLHLQLRPGTNVAVLNGLQHLLIENGHVDQKYVQAHTVGFEDLKRTVGVYTPELVERISGVPAEKLRAAAEIVGTSPTLVSAALQGVYQSNQATAAACQINNVHLLRGLIGKPGSGVFQMNGQPTAQNTRETGADGELVGFRNWLNPEHVREVARLLNVSPDSIPHGAQPAHALEIFRLAELGSVKMLWVICTNPAVSLPDLARTRHILAKEDLFLVVQDAFLTETAALADVVLPAAIWGEKTGTFTNADRTVHLSLKAVEPPGEAKSDLDIFLDYARRMDFRDRDGQPLVGWHDAEGAFDAFKELTRGRPCDYSGLSHARLLGGSGIQWPCHEGSPDGTERLYADGVFPTRWGYCQTYGHDLEVGAGAEQEEYRANDPNGRARLRAAAYRPLHEEPGAEYPLILTTGRRVYHFHTRTKTGRSPELNAAAPDGFVQINPEDAGQYGISEGDWVEITSRRGTVFERARLGGVEPGTLFIPFHYGYWDDPGRPRAVNELTLYEVDPVSKQPHYKASAVRVRRVTEGHVARQRQPQTVAGQGD
ncbi:nitrate reductase catalytic subunit (plasmid) [Deinococcus aetherius]|uniref:Nitrate reductase catalytic subunit n=1 Tax=Deinococcus aetherius TaxID=200252 RepID=A0ABM8AI25_9DEIO|nr:nitrate reductase [Deinococcus aetherius]BDP43458.1 nitrate reductase catalytic subunit [Deinococcus aetherius]